MLKNIMNDILEQGGRPLIVGGYVRDMILGVPSKDIDVEVYGLSVDRLIEILKKYGPVDQVGASFGVIKLGNYDFSLPRRENKQGIGHKGFQVEPDPSMTIEEAAKRRDFTINSIGMDVDGKIVDPFGGVQDLENKILRATSVHFMEDPLRVLRGFQFISRFDLEATAGTYEMSIGMKDEYHTLSKERVFGEWYKWAEKCLVPSKGLVFLKKCRWLELYPELNELIGCQQDAIYHPEGWLATLSVNSSFTASTNSTTIDFDMFRKLVYSSITDSTRTKPIRSTPITETINISSNNSFSRTFNTGPFSLDLSSIFSPTITTDSKCFVRFGHATSTTDKSIRIMFKIPLSSMYRIMEFTVNDFEVIDRIISPISVFMMNMFTSEKWASNMILHNQSVNPNASFLGPGNFTVPIIPPRITDLFFNISANNILFTTDIFFDNDFWHDNIAPYFVKRNITDDIIHQNVFEIKIGDVWTHILHVVDAMDMICCRDGIVGEDKVVLMFAALLHDVGKPSTTIREDGRIKSPGHDKAGVELARTFLESIGCFPRIIEKVERLVELHMVHVYGNVNLKKLANRLAPSNIYELLKVIEADHSGRPPLPGGLPQVCHDWLDKAKEMEILNSKPKPLVLGRHLLDRMNPGPEMGQVLKNLYERQLNGEFSTLEDGLKLI